MAQQRNTFGPAGVQDKNGRVRSPDEVVWRELEDEIEAEIREFERFLEETGDRLEDF